jgi:hypothetical protein
MLSNITKVLAFAMVIITVVPASVETSFARGRSAHHRGHSVRWQHETAYGNVGPDGRDRMHQGTTMGGYHYRNGVCQYESGPCYRYSPQ